ncbi:MAG: hypothetical protein LBR31_04435 [Desulfovibrio sp.]|jgi:hypothetical protein|nr:hypothetical protein [Desulfovibrio sp.]
MDSFPYQLLAFCIFFVFLLPFIVIFLEMVGALLQAILFVITACVAIPAFILSPRQFLKGYRLGKEYPGIDPETALALENAEKVRLKKKYPYLDFEVAKCVEDCEQ